MHPPQRDASALLPPRRVSPAGHSLLKKKADALNMRFRQILRKIVETKEEMGRVMKASFFSLAQVGALSWCRGQHTLAHVFAWLQRRPRERTARRCAARRGVDGCWVLLCWCARAPLLGVAGAAC